MNRLLSLPLDSSISFQLSFHESGKYVATCIDCSCFVFEVDLAAPSPAYHEIKVAKDYLSGAKFVDARHIILGSGDGKLYVYNVFDELVISTISSPPLKGLKGDGKRKPNDIVCFDFATLRCLRRYFGEVEKRMVVFATLSREICVFDVTRIMDDAQFARRIGPIEATQLQKMTGHFGSDIRCVSISGDGKFMAIGAEDNSFNIYCVSVRVVRNTRYHHSVRIEWVLLAKLFVRFDRHIHRVQWLDDRTLVASTDAGNELHLAAMYEIRGCEGIIALLVEALRRSDDRRVAASERTMRLVADVVLQYVLWIILEYTTRVDFEGKISCIATCPDANDGAGLVVVGGFSNVLQGIVPLAK